MIQQKNQAIAELESEKFEASIALFEKLAEELPAEPLVHTDLVVAYILLLKSPTFSVQSANSVYRRAVEKAEEAVSHLLQVAGDSATSHLLASKVARLVPDERRSLEELNRSVDLTPDDPILWYEMFQAGRYSEDAEIKARAREGLKRTHELWPDNLSVVRECLLQQAVDQDPAITETLRNARTTIEPLVESSPTWRKLNLLSMLDQTIAIASNQSLDGEGKWNTVLAKVRPLTNVLSADHATRIDRRRIDRQDAADPGELAFVIHDFSESALTTASPVSKELGPPRSVKFVPLPKARQLPPLPRVRGVELVDFDLDGRLDVVAVREQTVEVYSRGKTGDDWKLLSAFESPKELQGVVAADLDRDFDSTAAGGVGGRCPNADLDLVAYGPGGLLVLENKLDEKTGHRSLPIVRQAAAFEQLRNVLAVAVVDLDHDGNLDLVVSLSAGISLWLNRGDVTFEDISDRASLPPADFHATAIVPVDWNRDGDVDVLLAGPSSKTAGCLANLRHGRFRWEPFSADYHGLSGAKALCLADVDGNRSWDLIAGGERGVTLMQTATSESGPVRCLKSSDLGTEAVGGMTTWDYDNDGHLDLLAWGQGRLVIYRGGSDGQFHPALGLVEGPPTRVEVCAVGDLDGDGDWDLLVVEPERLVWYANEGGNGNHWLDVALRADPHPSQYPDLAVNMHGIGSLLEVKVGPLCQRQLVARSTSHFGLGAYSHADVVRILWTNSTPCNTINPESNQLLSKDQKHRGM
ncbi:MAG: CRTAC1 family protein [Planctomycetota bacterium]|nr:CRTAC1 family protein [Planctomycetota bacterium]